MPELAEEEGLAELAGDLGMVGDPGTADRRREVPVLRIEVDLGEVDIGVRRVLRERYAVGAIE